MAGGAAAVVGIEVDVVPAPDELAVGGRSIEGRFLNLHAVLPLRHLGSVFFIRHSVFRVAGRLGQRRLTCGRLFFRERSPCGRRGHQQREDQREKQNRLCYAVILLTMFFRFEFYNKQTFFVVAQAANSLSFTRQFLPFHIFLYNLRRACYNF